MNPRQLKARRIVDGDRGNSARVILERDQLQECLHAVHRAHVGCGGQRCLRRRDLQLVALVFIHALHSAARAGHFECEHK